MSQQNPFTKSITVPALALTTLMASLSAMAVPSAATPAVPATGATGSESTQQAPAPLAENALLITEVNPDNTGTDDFEYFEVHNTTDRAIDLDASGVRIVYHNSVTLVRGGEGTSLPLPAVDTVIPAGGTVVFWMMNSGAAYLAKTEAEFRAFYPDMPADVPVVRVTGQNGFSNGGDRALRLLNADDSLISRAHVPARTSSGATANAGVHFRLPASGADAAVLRDHVAGEPNLVTPGVVAPEQLVAAPETPTPTPTDIPTDVPAPTPTPTLTPTDVPTPTTTPTVTPTATPTGTPQAPLSHRDLFISELMIDNGTPAEESFSNIPDTFEYIELTNTTAAAIDLAERQIGLAYTTSGSSTPEQIAAALKWAVSDGVAGNAVTPGPLAVTVPARSSVLLWLDYTSADVNTYPATEAEFRAHHQVPEDVAVIRIEGQGGMANGGNRTVGLVDLSGPERRTLTSSVPETRSPTRPGVSAHFALSDGTRTVALPNGASTPGRISEEQTSATSTPTPTDGPTHPVPTPTPTDGPTGPGIPAQPAPPAVKPGLKAPILQVTEVAPDTANVGGSDGYEFVEIYNASEKPQRWRDFTINYLHIDGSGLVTSSVLWPSIPDDTTIDPGQTVVLWVKNAANQALTAADFNAHYGSNLAAGVELLEMHNGGMANGGGRGIQVMTNTGHEISRADYQNDEQTLPDAPIQYRWDSGTNQTLVGTGPATPGYTSSTQVPDGLVAAPASDVAPTVEDLRGTSDAPLTDDLNLSFRVSDDHQVRTVALTLSSNTDATADTRLLRHSSPERYDFSVPAADLFGKKWVEYSLEVRDGTHVVRTEPVRVRLGATSDDSVRLNVAEGDYVSGKTRLAGTTDDAAVPAKLSVNGVDLGQPVEALEAAPLFAFDASATDAFFRNGVKLGDEVINIFDQGFYGRRETVATEVPVEQVRRGEPLTLTVWAGTKGYPEVSLDDNNDDFNLRNVRLALPDGRVLRPTLVGVNASSGKTAFDPPRRVPLNVSPTTNIEMGDGNGNYDWIEATFDIPDDAFTARAHLWDTTAVADGEHVVTATDGVTQIRRSVRVDNTAPALTSSVSDGAHLRGRFDVTAEATDSGSGVESLTATLDGEEIELPLATSSTELEPGAHTLKLAAVDAVGNEVEKTIAFTTGDESSQANLLSPTNGAEVPAGDVKLKAQVTSAEGDDLTVSFRKGHTFDPTDDEIGSYTGSTETAAETERATRELLSGDDLAALATKDGNVVEERSLSALPYQQFTVNVPADAGDDASVRVAWDGVANAGAKVQLRVLDVTTNTWELVDEHVTSPEAGEKGEEFALGGNVAVKNRIARGELTFLVQHSVGHAGADRSSRDSATAAFHPDAVDRKEYDFTIGWQSDTQYYNENQGHQGGQGNPETFYRHQQNINDFFLAQRDALNLKYVIHTGDVVDDALSTSRAAGNDDPEYQWRNADASYRKLDEAGLPYGVLAGNHDVHGADADYTQFSKWFGRDRYEDNAWWGGDYRDNRGHYDLISAGGVDFLMLSMGWAPGDEAIDWMNEVIAAHPERKVWINLHEYLLTTGTLGPIPQRIYDEVVAPNPNVFAVSSGHYHDAYTRPDQFDDNGDGVADRTVYSMLFDYQGLPEGGLGYLRLLHFDNAGERILVRTYSPSLGRFNSDEPSLNDPAGQQEFEIPYAAAGIASQEKSLATDAFSADVLTTTEIASRAGVTSGSEVEVDYTGVASGLHGWYVHTSGEHGGRGDSAVATFTAEAPGELVTSEPTVVGDARVGRTLFARPGVWGPAGVRLSYQWFADGREIAGATEPELFVGAALADRVLSVRVAGELAGHTAVDRRSTPTAPVAAGHLVTAEPSVSGTARTGRTLTVRPGAWEQGVAVTQQWLANGREIAGATGMRLRLTPAMVGKQITARVTARRTGFEDSVVEVSAGAVKRGLLQGRQPRVSGKVAVGSVLRSDAGAVTPKATVSYQWFAGQRRIVGATSKRLRLTPAMAGTKVSVRVTAKRPGYATWTKRSLRTVKVSRR